MSWGDLVVDVIKTRTVGDLVLIFAASLIVGIGLNFGVPLAAEALGWRVSAPYPTYDDLHRLEQRAQQNAHSIQEMGGKLDTLSEKQAEVSVGLLDQWIIEELQRMCNSPAGSEARASFYQRLQTLKGRYQAETGRAYPPTSCDGMVAPSPPSPSPPQ
jgi:hypothetical protein